MEIPVLQSLIKRTSNEIVACEILITIYYEYGAASVEMEEQCSKYIQRERNNLKKLVNLQKALKKEMATLVWEMQFDRFFICKGQHK